MTRILTGAGVISAALLVAGCGDAGSTNSQMTNAVAAATNTVANAPPSAPPEASADPALAMPTSWMPADWDRNVYPGSGEPLSEDGIRQARQNMLATVPFTLWAVANDTMVTEAFEPIWVWYTAIRSCERGIQMNEDLAGEFGNRERGKAELVQARKDLKAWAATQPKEMTLYFTARLGQWNEETGTFQLQQLGRATTLKPKDVAYLDPFLDGATVELWTDRTGQAINHFQASLVAPQCASKDKTKVYKFQRMSQWWVVFGDVDRGMGGLANYKTREFLPAISMTREQAASLAQRNPDRKVEVAVTFAPVGSSFVKYSDQSAIRAKYRQVTVTDALDNSVLVQKTY
jgi:hypothetical protein